LSQLELLFWLEYAPSRCRLGFIALDPTGGLSASPETLAAFRAYTSKGRIQGREGEGNRRRTLSRGREGKERKRKGGKEKEGRERKDVWPAHF